MSNAEASQSFMDEVCVAPKVSVLMPVFNAGPFVREAVQSVFAQTFRDFELIAIDDGSRDDSLRTLNELARGDARMRVISRENRGVIATRNELLSLGTGELAAWMDADDVCYPERFAKQVEVFDREPALMCLGTSLLQIDPEGMPMEFCAAITDRAAIRKGFAVGDGVSFASCMMRRQPAIDVGGFRMPFLIGEDFDLILRLSEIGDIGNIDACLLKYRQHVSSVSRQHRASWPVLRDFILELAEERRTLGTDALQRGEPAVLRPSAPPSLPERSEVHLRWARQALEHGFAETARKHALKALIENPRSLASWRSALRTAIARSQRRPTGTRIS